MYVSMPLLKVREYEVFLSSSRVTASWDQSIRTNLIKYGEVDVKKRR